MIVRIEMGLQIVLAKTVSSTTVPNVSNVSFLAPDVPPKPNARTNSTEYTNTTDTHTTESVKTPILFHFSLLNYLIL